MRVLRQYYAGDATRWRAHMAKLHDPMEAVQRAAGRRYGMAAILRHNAIRSKTGVGSDAPRWWKEGRHARLAEYCAGDVSALVDMVMRKEMRVPGMGVTRGASVLAWLRDEGAATAAGQTPNGASTSGEAPVEPQQEAPPPHRNGEAPGARSARKRPMPRSEQETEPPPARRQTRREENCNCTNSNDDMPGGTTIGEATTAAGASDATASAAAGANGAADDARAVAGGADAATEADTGEEDGVRGAQCTVHAAEGSNPETPISQSRKRRRGSEKTYGTAVRRQRQRGRGEAYMERGRGGGIVRHAVAVGPVVVERTVGGRYEWRDAGLVRTTGAVKRHYDEVDWRALPRLHDGGPRQPHAAHEAQETHGEHTSSAKC